MLPKHHVDPPSQAQIHTKRSLVDNLQTHPAACLLAIKGPRASYLVPSSAVHSQSRVGVSLLYRRGVVSICSMFVFLTILEAIKFNEKPSCVGVDF